MASEFEKEYRSVLEACAFAARAHGAQLRKDGKTPYISHPFRVCLVVRDLFGVEDKKVLAAAVLHDTVEDTTKDFDDIKEAFGEDVASWVAALTKDKRRAEAEREADYGRQLAGAPWQVKVCKLADMFDNLMDSIHTEPEQQAKTFRNTQRYLDVLRPGLPERARQPWDIVAQLLAGMESQLASKRSSRS